MDGKPNLVLATAITAVLSGAVLNQALEEQAPACILAIPATASSCPVKWHGAPHAHHEDFASPDSGSAAQMPFLLRTSAENFFNHQYGPARRDFPQAEHQGRNLVLLTSKAAQAVCPEKAPPQHHVHADSGSGVAITPRPGSLGLEAHASAVATLTATLTNHIESACPDTAPKQHHLERKDGDAALHIELPPPNPIRQAMASYPDQAAYETQQPVLGSAAFLSNSSDSVCPEKQSAPSHTHHEPEDAFPARGGFILKEDGGYLLTENGGRIALENG